MAGSMLTLLNTEAVRAEARRMRSDARRLLWAKIIAAALILAGALDTFSTEIALATGYAYEANPVIRTLQETIGSGWILVKMGAHLMLALALIWYPNRLTLVAMAGVTALTFVVAINNLLIYQQILSIVG